MSIRHEHGVYTIHMLYTVKMFYVGLNTNKANKEGEKKQLNNLHIFIFILHKSPQHRVHFLHV